MTRRKRESTKVPSNEEQSNAIQARIKTITEARNAIRVAMRALPPPSLPDAHSTAAREQITSHLAEKYLDMAFASLAYRPPSARNLVESQISKVNKKATELFELLEGLDPLGVEALHLAMKELGYRPAKRRLFLSAVIDPPPKAIGDIKGRLEVLIDAADRAEVSDATKSLKGPGQKVDALEIAKAAAADYFELTGRGPTRTYKDSSFVDFLTAIFDALGIQASPGSSAKDVITQWMKAKNDAQAEPDVNTENEGHLEELMLTRPPERVEEYAVNAGPITPLEAFAYRLDWFLLGSLETPRRGQQCPHLPISPHRSASMADSCGTVLTSKTTSAV
jgi:hypothetical protein